MVVKFDIILTAFRGFACIAYHNCHVLTRFSTFATFVRVVAFDFGYIIIYYPLLRSARFLRITCAYLEP